MTEIMIFTHYRLNNLSFTTVIHVNNLCPQVGDGECSRLCFPFPFPLKPSQLTFLNQTSLSLSTLIYNVRISGLEKSIERAKIGGMNDRRHIIALEFD
jgi:hypothetical protein